MQLTLIFIGINVAVFILQQLGMFSGMSFMPATFTHEPWTMLTSMFMHGSLQHLMLNMLGLFMFGSVVEKEFGKLKWVILYFFAGFSGSLAYILLSPSPFIPALGASGAIFGLMAGAAVLKPKMIIWTAYGPFPMIIAAIGWGIAEFVGMFGVDTIAQSAHIGGLISGAVIALIFMLGINPKILIASLLAPLLMAFFAAATLPNEIGVYTNVPDGFHTNYSQHGINIKHDMLTDGENWIIITTSPSEGDFNLAIYSRYLASEVLDDYQILFGPLCSSTLDYNVNENNGTAVVDGELCSKRFSAKAAVCNGNVDVRIIEFYTDTSKTENFVSCKGLTS